MTDMLMNFEIKQSEDVYNFFREIHKRYPYEWHPDDDFEYFEDSEGKRVFSNEEAENLNKIMISCFQFCDDNDLDIYEIAGNVQIEIWKSQGLWPPKK